MVGQPGQAVWLWVGRTKLLADDQASDWLEDEPGALSVMYSMLSLVKCCSQGNRRGFLGFPPRVSQPAALCGILEDTVVCSYRALGDALCWAITLKKCCYCFFFLITCSFLVHYMKPYIILWDNPYTDIWMLNKKKGRSDSSVQVLFYHFHQGQQYAGQFDS